MYAPILFYSEQMNATKNKDVRTGMAELAAKSLSKLLRASICDTELKDCQRDLKEYEIPKKMLDPEELRSRLTIRSYIYGRMSDLCTIKGEHQMARLYRLLEDGLHNAIIYSELPKHARHSDKGINDEQKSGRGKKKSGR